MSTGIIVTQLKLNLVLDGRMEENVMAAHYSL